MPWAEWKERNAALWDFVTAPLIVVVVAVLVASKWLLRACRLIR